MLCVGAPLLRLLPKQLHFATNYSSTGNRIWLPELASLAFQLFLSPLHLRDFSQYMYGNFSE